jgi:hypothetical protein
MGRPPRQTRPEDHHPALANPASFVFLQPMSVLEVKQAITKMSRQERREIQLYLIKLRHSTPAWKRATAKRIRDMQAGKFTTIEELEARIARG